MFAVSVKTAIQLFGNGTKNYAGIVGKALNTRLLKSVGNLLDDVRYFFYTHNEYFCRECCLLLEY